MSRLIILGLVWAALSAATAYFADLWGRKLGKQRKSLFGWRPKQTAVFIITSAGAVIALLSFAVLLTADAGIRKALTQWDQTVRQLDASTAEISAAKVQLQTQREMIQTAQDRVTAANTERTRAERANASAQANLRELKKRVIAAQQNVAAAENRLRTVQSTLTLTRTRLTSTRADLNRATQYLGQTRTQLTQTQAQLRMRKRDLVRAKQNLQTAQQQLNRATSIANEYTVRALKAERVVDQALLGGMIRRDEELTREAVVPQRTLQQAREAVAKALNEARANVIARSDERGVKFRPTDKPLQLARKAMRVASSTGMGAMTLTDRQVIDAVAIQLMRPNSPAPGGVVLQVIATDNAAPGETVPVDFRLYENHVVFEKDQEISRFIVEQGESREQVMADITNAMQNVSREARRKGLLPSPDQSVMELSFFQLAETYNRVVDALARGQRRVPVTITADADTWTAGPLNLRIVVKRSEDEA